MCGLAGFIDNVPYAEKIAGQMIAAIVHRGPDSQDVWTQPDQSIALAHARLAVIDLAPTGAQPMHSPTGRYVIAYNGEVYNHAEIREKLESSGNAVNWRGFSDTETILAAIDAWGLDKCLDSIIGMFAFALWDTQTHQLSLVRDRFGEKPLYYQPTDNGVIFASEISSIEQHPKFKKDINFHAVKELSAKHAISAPHSIFNGVYKLLPGTLITFNTSGFVCTRDWWSPIEQALSNKSNTWTGSSQDALSELEQRLGDAVKRQMFADVPLGAFLSGGIDSTLIVALMQQHSSHPIQTFTIGFENPKYNEAQYASQVAKHLGTSHTEHYVTESEIHDLVPKLSTIFSEPFSDSSQIPTYLISELARKSVTVALTGDAGDEIFAGYNRHSFVKNQWPSLQKIPYGLRKIAASVAGNVTEENLDQWLRYLPGTSNWSRAGEKFRKSKNVLHARNLPELYEASTTLSNENYFSAHVSHIGSSTQNRGPQASILQSREELAIEGLGNLDDVNWIMLKDQMNYLPNDILAKVDRSSMATSLETRAPFLDHTLTEFCQTLPSQLLIDKKQTKAPLRKLLRNYVPDQLMDRPKMGFAIPIHEMLRGPLKEWAKHHLSEGQIKNAGCFNSEEINTLFQEHLNGKNNINALWPVLSFQSWHEQRYR